MNTNPQHLGKYILHQCLGRGGMAEVWKAFDIELKRYVAIKFLHANLRSDPDFMKRFLREAQALASLHHPNIVQIYDFQTSSVDDSNPVAYMVMDYVEGHTLASYMQTTSRVRRFPPPGEQVNLLTSICLAVDYAHRRGMLHRDIKPANILLDTRNMVCNPMGEPILTDFGIVKMMGTTSGTLTSAGTGSPLYISPEQAQGYPGDERSDIYSLGVILYEMCTGQLPFQDKNQFVIMMKHITEMPVRPKLINPDLSPSLEEVILCCLTKDPQARFPSATSLVTAIAEACSVPLPERFHNAASLVDIEEHLTHHHDVVYDATDQPSQDKVLPPDDNQHILTIGRALKDASITYSTILDLSMTPPNQQIIDPPSPPLLRSRPSSVTSATLPVLSQQAPLPSPAPGSIRRRGWHRSGLLLVLLLIMLSGSVMGTYISLHAHTHVVGQAYFMDSGLTQELAGLGSNDSLQIALHDIPDPAPNKSYYAWLVLDNNQALETAIPLGTLTMNHGRALLSHPYTDPHHDNLLNYTKSLFITEEDASILPLSPSLDRSSWRYHAQFDQTPGTDGVSSFVHLRYLLAGTPELQQQDLYGGLAYWLLHNVDMVWQWSLEANDPVHFNAKWDADILSYLQGPCAHQDINDHSDPRSKANYSATAHMSISLLDCSQDLASGYQGLIRQIIQHLNGVIQSPGASADQLQLTLQIIQELNSVNARLEQVLQDAQQLVALPKAQLRVSPLLSDLQLQASYAVSGWYDPDTHIMHPGIRVIYGQIQSLATLDMVTY